MSHEPEAPESEFVRKWKHDSNATILQAVQIIATLTAERDEAVCIALDNAAARDTLIEQRDALRTALEEVQLRARIMSVPDADCGEEVLRDVFLHIADFAREALGGKR